MGGVFFFFFLLIFFFFLLIFFFFFSLFFFLFFFLLIFFFFFFFFLSLHFFPVLSLFFFFFFFLFYYYYYDLFFLFFFFFSSSPPRRNDNRLQISIRRDYQYPTGTSATKMGDRSTGTLNNREEMVRNLETNLSDCFSHAKLMRFSPSSGSKYLHNNSRPRHALPQIQYPHYPTQSNIHIPSTALVQLHIPTAHTYIHTYNYIFQVHFPAMGRSTSIPGIPLKS